MFKDELVTVTTPLLFSVSVPRTVVPFLKVTVPVGVPDVEDFTLAVIVTLWPTLDGLTEETTDVEVAALATFCINTGEVLAR
jgi:hypothetical protein